MGNGLYGKATHTLDPKGRVVIPSKYRGAFGSTVYALSGAGGCIRLYSEAEFFKVIEKLRAGGAQTNIFKRKLLSSVEQLNIDSQGRILIPEDLRKAAGITDKAYMVGMIEWLELWNREIDLVVDEQLSPEDELTIMIDIGLA